MLARLTYPYVNGLARIIVDCLHAACELISRFLLFTRISLRGWRHQERRAEGERGRRSDGGNSRNAVTNADRVAASEGLPALRFSGHVIVANSYAAMNVWDVVAVVGSVSTKHVSTQSLPSIRVTSSRDHWSCSRLVIVSDWSGADRIACTITESSIDRAKTPARLACVPESDQLPSPCNCNCRPFLCGRRLFPIFTPS